jgi:hypothetical protein
LQGIQGVQGTRHVWQNEQGTVILPAPASRNGGPGSSDEMSGRRIFPMSDNNLINKFQKAHAVIHDTVEQIQLSIRSYPKVRSGLMALQENLFGYFAQQDRVFYDQLLKAHQDNREKVKMIEFLAWDIKDFKVEFIRFYDQYDSSVGVVSQRNFPKEFTDFAQRIIARLKVEEEYLFPLF